MLFLRHSDYSLCGSHREKLVAIHQCFKCKSSINPFCSFIFAQPRSTLFVRGLFNPVKQNVVSNAASLTRVIAQKCLKNAFLFAIRLYQLPKEHASFID